VLSLTPSTKIFLVSGVTDMRKHFDSLAAVVSGTLKEDPLSGHVFVFCNRRRNRIKILFWDNSGFWVCAKRLERGTFVWPDGSELSYPMSSDELGVLLAGVDLLGARRRRWYERTSECNDSKEKA